MNKISSRSIRNGFFKTAALGTNEFFKQILDKSISIQNFESIFEAMLQKGQAQEISRQFNLLNAAEQREVRAAFDAYHPRAFKGATADIRAAIANAAAAVRPAVTAPQPTVAPPVVAPPVVAPPVVAPVAPPVAPPVTPNISQTRGTPPGVVPVARPPVAPPIAPAVTAPSATSLPAATPGAITAPGKGMGAKALDAAKDAKAKVSKALTSGMESFKLLTPKGKAGVILGVVALIGGSIWAMSEDEIVAEGEAELDSYNSIMQPVFDSEIGGYSYGGEISDIGEEGKTEVIAALTAAVGSGDRASLSPEGIVGIIAGTSGAQSASGLSKEELETALKDEPEFKAVVEAASSQLLAKVDAAAASGGGTTPPGPGGSGSGGSGPLPPPISGGGSQGTSGNDGYDLASSILKEKGYLKEIQSDWTPEFDAAFREFVDAGTATGKVPTNLVGGQSWSDVAGSLGVSPNKSGAFSIINSLANVTPQKGSASSDPSASTQPTAPSETKPAATVSGGNPILAAIIGAMNNEKLVGTPGLDFVKEPKRIQALVDAAGGANPAGYGNVADILAQQNPSLLAKLPKELTGPVDKTFAKDPANKALLQAIQVTINKIYNSAIPAVIKPNLEKSTELISAWLATPAGGNWSKAGSNSDDQWVKLASERKMRIRAKIAAEMTPAERAAARRIRMRGSI